MIIEQLYKEVLSLLRQLIAIESFSKAEDKTADRIQHFFQEKQIHIERFGNNIIVKNKYFNPNLPTILLNSHHDTVKPAAGWKRNPFSPDIEDGILYGLGSNDAGASLVALAAAFLYFYDKKILPYNLIYAATAEEEISGKNGIVSILDALGEISVAIVGEPTQMRMAIAEKGLMVIDGLAHGKAGHAARDEGINALYIALQDINWIKNFIPSKTSDFLGKTKLSVTQIQAGTQHNVVPDYCTFVIDVRTNELYSNEAIFQILQENTQSELTARSFRLNSSRIELEHPLVQRGINLELEYFGSPTLSDQALMPFPSLKIGCGKSARSHTAGEHIYLQEIEEGIQTYIQLLDGLQL